MRANVWQDKQSHTDTLTFRAEQHGGALQEVSDLLQRSFLSAADAALRAVASRRGGGLITDDSELWLARSAQREVG